MPPHHTRSLLILAPIAATILHALPLIPTLGYINVAIELSRSLSPYWALWALASATLSFRDLVRTPSIALCIRSVGLLLTALWLALPLRPFFFHTPSTGSGVHLRVLYANVFGPNKQYEKLLQLIEEHQPDVVALLEAHEGWREGLRLKAKFPNRVEVVNRFRDGKLFYSKRPITTHLVRRSRDARGTVIDLQLEVAPTTYIRYGLAHAASPISPGRLQWRSEFLSWVADTFAESPIPTIVSLDMNTSPFTFDYQHFAEQLGSANAFWGQGFQPTWRPFRFFPLQVPIDHTWYSAPITIQSAQILGDIGSDHLPLLFDFVIPGPG